MKTSLLATLIGTLLAAGAAVPLTVLTANGHGPFVDDNAMPGADESALHGGHAGDDHHAQIGMERPRFAPATGTVPSAQAAGSLEEVSSIWIQEDAGFTPSNGIRSGSGTPEDPYVISGYHVAGDLYLGDTNACVIVKENYVNGQLTLNWNGQCVHVHHNYIRDLRVNENIMRTGYATGGLLEANKITFVGQLRHYDGEFRNNVVGPFTPGDVFDQVLETVPFFAANDPRVANVDGFNQGLIHHNTFYGPVDLDLHGHHHGTGFFAPHSHYHGSNETTANHHPEDHTDRWTSVAFTDNKIVDHEYYGLRYEDQNHAGDDRTANSEDNMMLEEPHVHHTSVEISRNLVEGGQIHVDIFNADDELHYARNPGTLLVLDNQVVFEEKRQDGPLGLFLFGELPVMNSAIIVSAAKEVETVIQGNRVEFKAAPDDGQPDLTMLPFFQPYYEDTPTGITLVDMRDANVTVMDNTVKDFTYGVAGYRLDEKVHWKVLDNEITGASHPVYYDESVANKPAER